MMRDKISKIDNVLDGLMRRLEKCDLCVRACGVNRLKGEEGACLYAAEPVVYSYFDHRGEEPAISGYMGSGTIFFSGCGMKCVYCQNHRFSQSRSGKQVSKEDLAGMMLKLEEMGCHNINFVSPTQFAPKILEALRLAYEKGLAIPTVYNTGGYDSLPLIKTLDGIIDIYLPDMRYSSDLAAEKYSLAPGYARNNREIVKEMKRQTGNLICEEGLAVKGLVIRLLVLPEDISGTLETLEFIERELGKDVCLSVMSQYHPVHKAHSFAPLARSVTVREYNTVIKKLDELGLSSGWRQPLANSPNESLLGENFDPNT
ncbi:MAG: radical SAM protein [Candidatus Omnitrophica bacterium]|nr:radical SAM protein [Candidatus Omnitrophota bacterium]